MNTPTETKKPCGLSGKLLKAVAEEKWVKEGLVHDDTDEKMIIDFIRLIEDDIACVIKRSVKDVDVDATLDQITLDMMASRFNDYVGAVIIREVNDNSLGFFTWCFRGNVFQQDLISAANQAFFGDVRMDR